MERQIVQFLFLIFTLTVACRRAEPVMPLPANPPADRENQIKSFDQPVVLIIYPDILKADSLKNLWGNDRFFTLSDLTGAELVKTREFAAEHRIPSWSGTTGIYRFKTSEGTLADIDLRSNRNAWNLIIFNGKDLPIVTTSEKGVEGIRSAFNLKEAKPHKQARQRKSAEVTPEPAAESSGLPDGLPESLPRIRETTLRIILFPGQEPPALRNKTDGIRIVSSYISPLRRFWIDFDNDLFSYTDRYYTNGIVIGYTAPGLTSWKVNRLMLNLRHHAVVHSSISLHHGMFTPLTTKTPPPLHDDRPYASTLFMRYRQVSEDAEAGIRLSSALEAGVIGDAALGQLLQKTVHSGIPSNDEPQGWETQIRNDLVLNYQINVQKQIVQGKHAGAFATGGITAGTLYTRATMGVNAIAGVCQTGLTPLPDNYDDLNVSAGKVQYGANGGFEMYIVGYDASLQGGLFNKTNIYALKPDEIERLVAALHLGLFVSYGKLGANLSQYWLSPEFKGGRQHFWGRIGLEYRW